MCMSGIPDNWKVETSQHHTDFQPTFTDHQHFLSLRFLPGCRSCLQDPQIDLGVEALALFEPEPSKLPRKEVIQPHLPVRLPCYDFTPVTSPTFDGSLPKGWATGFGCCSLPWCDGRCVQDPGTYSPWCADPRLLATPASCRRVASYNPN